MHARHSPRKQDPPLAQRRLDSLDPRLHKGFEVGDLVVGASALSPSGAAGQNAVVGSAQRIVVARVRAPRDTAVQHCLEYFGFQHLELEGGARSVVQFEGILPEAAPGIVYAPVDLDGLVGVVVDVSPEVLYLAGSLDSECSGGIRHPPCAQTHDLSLGLRNGQTKRRARGHDHIHHLPELLR